MPGSKPEKFVPANRVTDAVSEIEIVPLYSYAREDNNLAFVGPVVSTAWLRLSCRPELKNDAHTTSLEIGPLKFLRPGP